MSRCMAHPSLGSVWRGDCSPLASRSKWCPCSIHGRDYEPPTSRRACWRVRELRRCRNSYDLCSWIVWDLEDGKNEIKKMSSSCNQRRGLCNLDNVDRLEKTISFSRSLLSRLWHGSLSEKDIKSSRRRRHPMNVSEIVNWKSTNFASSTRGEFFAEAPVRANTICMLINFHTAMDRNTHSLG